MKRKICCCRGSCVRILGTIYDIFTATVSLLDVITDLIVLAEFYILGRMAFFYASLTILIIAQLAYCIAFWIKFEHSFKTMTSAAIIFCCMIPFAPILSFAFYYTGSDQAPLSLFLERLFSSFTCDCGVVTQQNKNNNNTDKDDEEMAAFKEWIKTKLMKHLGFIIEALIEAFPQSILQLIAIVYFNDSDNYIAMSSILLSMISVSTKTFILSVIASYNWKSAIFNWICCVTDFFGIFFIISFAFYVPTGNESNPFEVIQYVWISSIMISIIPFALIGSIGINIYCTYELSQNWCGWLFFVQIGWIVGLCITIMSMSISCFIIFAAILLFNGLPKRLGDASSFYLPLIAFIRNAEKININIVSKKNKNDKLNLKISKKQHEIIRVCCINHVLYETMTKNLDDDKVWTYNEYNKALHDYLIQHSKQQIYSNNYPYSHVTLKDIKYNKNKTRTTWYNKLLSIYGELQEKMKKIFKKIMLNCSLFLLNNVCLAIYLMGRIFNILFILFIVCYLSFGHNIHIFTNDIPLFQTVMFIAYLILLCLWILSLFSVLREKHYASFILPSTDKLRASQYNHINKNKTRDIMDYYYSVVSQPVAERYCINLFGIDITTVIMRYYGTSQFMVELYDDTTKTVENEQKQEEEMQETDTKIIEINNSNNDELTALKNSSLI